MNDVVGTWPMWIGRGIASVIFGVLTVMHPGASIGALVFIYGVYALVDGALLLGFAFRQKGGKGPYIGRGLVSIAAGLTAYFLPGPTALVFYFLIGAWAVTAGIAELAIAVALRKDGFRVVALVVAGVLSLLCGVALLALPVAGVIALVSVIAAYAVINGAALIAAGVRIRSLDRTPATA
jgi:uncharacterized membrane protein HdeD (DUF308 family)